MLFEAQIIVICAVQIHVKNFPEWWNCVQFKLLLFIFILSLFERATVKIVDVKIYAIYLLFAQKQTIIENTSGETNDSTS